MLRAQRGNGAPRLTDLQVRAEGWSYLAQGAQAITLTWAWALLGAHPGAERRLHAEVDVLSAPPTTDDLARLRFADAVVYETLRLYPPVWTIARVATAAYPLGGATVPKGSVILVSPYVTQRDARWWPDPLEFRPERWLEGSRRAEERRAFLAYGAGQRLCLGRNLVHLQCVLVLAAIARQWRLRPVSQPQIETFPFLQPKGGVTVRVERRA
ncbi:MAG: cytochrome P450 [Actinomycetota bacterium]|nr:cytochrome P450 [Actinomycetota bacterium]